MSEETKTLNIVLKKSETSSQNLNWVNLHAYPFKVEAYSNINLEAYPQDEAFAGYYPVNIFVMQRNGTGLDPNQGDRFVKMATVIDIEELPNYLVEVDATTELSTVKGFPFYRYNKLELFVNSPEELQDLWEFIVEDVNTLIDDYNRMLTVVNDQYIQVSGQKFDPSIIYTSDNLLIAAEDQTGKTTNIYKLGIQETDSNTPVPYIEHVNEAVVSNTTYDAKEMKLNITSTDEEGKEVNTYKFGIEDNTEEDETKPYILNEDEEEQGGESN